MRIVLLTPRGRLILLTVGKAARFLKVAVQGLSEWTRLATRVTKE
jgi:hypothetical protein